MEGSDNKYIHRWTIDLTFLHIIHTITKNGQQRMESRCRFKYASRYGRRSSANNYAKSNTRTYAILMPLIYSSRGL